MRKKCAVDTARIYSIAQFAPEAEAGSLAFVAVFMQMQVTAVFGIEQHFARLR